MRMQLLPHRYTVTARADAAADQEIVIEHDGLPSLPTALPAEFGGAGDRWSPETLLVGAIADCYALTCRGIAARSKLSWIGLEVQVTGTLDRVGHVTKFVEVHIQAKLTVAAGTSLDLATRVLAKAEETCLITRSMTATVYLNTAIETDAGRRPLVA
jgi:organic hydroperoxide reductase OsmC/OhrA